MANEQSGADDPQFDTENGFWGQPFDGLDNSDVPNPDEESQPLDDSPATTEAPRADDAFAAESDADAPEAADLAEVGTLTNDDLPEVYDAPEAAGLPEVDDDPLDPSFAYDPDSTGHLVRIREDNADGDAGGADSMAAAFSAYEDKDPNNAYSGIDDGLSEHGRRVRMTAVAAAVAVTLLVVYVLGVNRFSSRFLPNTSIQGHDVSGLTEEEAEKSLERETQEYECEISVDDYATLLKGVDLAVDRDEARIAREARAKQSAFLWPVSLLVPTDLAVDQNASFNEAMLTTHVNDTVEERNEKDLPKGGASIVYDEEEGTYLLQGTVDGTALDENAVLEAAKEDIRSFRRQSSPDPSVVLRPATVQDLPSYAHSVEWANRSRTTDIPLLVNGEQIGVSDAWQNAQWVTVDETPSVVVDEDAVRLWAEYTVSQLAYTRDDWNDYFLDEDAFVSGFVTRLATGVVDGYEVPTYVERRREGISRDRAYERGGWNSEMGRYIDVDLEAQFARLFDEKGEVLWESAVVSGNMYEAHSTVTGTFTIYSKQTGTVLVGFDYDNNGTPDYESYVNYWMPFYGGYGLHDATWRYNFGGDLYYYDGSHGCINLPYDKAEELYNMTYVGEVVNVHW